jgi:hypothetical protein
MWSSIHSVNKKWEYVRDSHTTYMRGSLIKYVNVLA